MKGSAEASRRSVRLRRQMIGLARAAADVLRNADSVQRAFLTLAPPALEALGVERVSLWERTEPDRLECRSTWPSSSHHLGLGRREASRTSATRTQAHPHLTPDMPGWLGELAQVGVGSLLDVSVLAAGGSWGRMAFECTRVRSWHADERAAAQHFADVFGVAVERERRREAEAQLSYLEMYDDTSGVANRALFLSNLRQQLKRMRRGVHRGSALLFVDVDRFHSVNEFFGEGGGNVALAAVAARLDQASPADALVGRLESDCFGILLPEPGAEWNVPFLAQRVLDAVAKPIVQDGRSWEASASVGIAFGSDDPAFTVEEWLRDADMASKEAKAAGRNRVMVFDPEQHQSLTLRLAIEQELRDALRDGRIEVAYQPEFDLETGAVVGAEALARLRHSDGRLIAAGEFIEVAEATGLIEPVGRIVLDAACAEARRWPAMPDGTPRTVRVNVSARQFGNGDLVEEVARALASSGLPAERLCLEITETTLMAKAEESLACLRAIKAVGVGLAIDDFGTGYSSLAYLKRFPVDVLKLDKTLVDGVQDDATVRAILRAVQGLAMSLQLEVVAEGIEHEDQIAPLRALGIHRVQGFHFARPEPALAFRERISAAAGPDEEVDA